MKWMIVGLGNPGKKYEQTRHNIGFMFVDYLAKKHPVLQKTNELKGEVYRIDFFEKQKVMLVKPQTFMNLSGECIKPLAQYYKINSSQIIVAHDDLDLPFGSMKLQKNRGSGGHNGIKSLTEHLSTNDYIRIRLGIGKPPHPEMKVPDYVLQKFSNEELISLNLQMEIIEKAAQSIIFDGLSSAANLYNGEKK